jgi:DNA-binding beta-propeller fold protein YncE
MRRSGYRLWLSSAVAAAALVLAGGVMAQPGPGGEPTANDGRRLSGETAATQAMFSAVWGSQAAGEWVREHNAALTGQPVSPAPAAPGPAAKPAPPTPTMLPVVPGDTTRIELTRIPIPPIQGKTLSADILDIDQDAHRLYVTDRTDNGIDIFDVSTPNARYLQTVDVGSGPNGVLVVKDLNKVFTGLNDSNVAILDIDPSKTPSLITKLNTGGSMRANELDYDPRTKKIYIENSDEGTDKNFVTVIDAQNNTIVTKVMSPGGTLEQPRYNPNDEMMYLSDAENSVLFQIDTTKDEIANRFPLGDPCNTNGLALNAATNQALLGCSNRNQQHMAVWDFATQKLVSTFDQSGAGDQALYDATVDRYFFAASNFFRGGQMAILGGSPVKFLTNVPTAVGSHGVAFDETNRIVYTQDQLPNEGAIFSFPLPNVQP